MIETGGFYFVGNNLSLDFVNTLIAENGKPRDLLRDFRNLVGWATVSNIIEEAKVRSFLVVPVKNGETALSEAIGFRRHLYDLFNGIVRRKGVESDPVAAINKILQIQNGYSEVVCTETGFHRHFRADLRDPRQILVPIAESAADLLCFGDLNLIKKCESRDCVLFFYDTTKNRKRRWCSMAACGNRAKAAAFYKRKKVKGKS